METEGRFDKYMTKGIERMFRGTPNLPLHQPSYPKNGFDKLLEKYNLFNSKINLRIKNKTKRTNN